MSLHGVENLYMVKPKAEVSSPKAAKVADITKTA
jgi:hypothetical protein